MKKIWVAAGVIENHQGEILIAKRLAHLHQGGKWEFPGGKVEANESALEALTRELSEEVGLVVTGAKPMVKLEHDYGDKMVILDVWHVTSFSGVATGLEGQIVQWVTKTDLVNFEFPAANKPIVAAILATVDSD
ncbi:MAG: 8-oxo-dGTP diphosphatase MutT [Gammaproteobacteria bacterium]|nr:8-oxo-dGTP diphosphatase MutT [Gammaproteobacteria bacterium]